MDLAEDKDMWDKAEIVGKVSLPVAVAVATLWLNGQVSQRQQSTEITKVAIGVLSEELGDDQRGIDPLREWAVARLSENYQFSDAARDVLLSGERSLSLTTGSLRETSYILDNEITEQECIAYVNSILDNSPDTMSDALVENLRRNIGEGCQDGGVMRQNMNRASRTITFKND